MAHRIAHVLVAGAAALLAGCDAPAATSEPIFLSGRAVEPDGDSLFAVTAGDAGALLIYDASGRVRDTLGLGLLRNPVHVQLQGDAWYVSDLEDGAPVVVVLGRDGTLRRRVPLAGIATQPHQFAVLADGAIVVEGSAGSLVAVREDSVSTFAVVEIGKRPSLVTGAGGGVLHAIPDQTITLYNGFGNIRWRVEWPWAESAFVSAIGEDSRGRIHFIAGVARDNTFVAYSMTPGTGEVVWWSEPQRGASFEVSRLGKLSPAEDPWATP
ncbi:MAG: hypothetical protein OEY20_16590 [Gemmatimonadota bacterium]|nr:hypothetical protein [Gemmatimonadota bacterium]MDH5198861.1 hypothetical protein [Gemmatimonadota bacterium]